MQISNEKIENLFIKLYNENYFYTDDQLQHTYDNWLHALENNVDGAKDYTLNGICQHYTNIFVDTFYTFVTYTLEPLKKAIENKDKGTLIKKVRYGQKLSIGIFTILTGLEVSNRTTNKELIKLINSL